MLLDYPGRVRSQTISVVRQIKQFDFVCMQSGSEAKSTSTRRPYNMYQFCYIDRYSGTGTEAPHDTCLTRCATDAMVRMPQTGFGLRDDTWDELACVSDPR